MYFMVNGNMVTLVSPNGEKTGCAGACENIGYLRYMNAFIGAIHKHPEGFIGVTAEPYDLEILYFQGKKQGRRFAPTSTLDTAVKQLTEKWLEYKNAEASKADMDRAEYTDTSPMEQLLVIWGR